MKRVLSVGMLMTASFALQADTLYLRDGRTIDGTFVSGDSREVRFTTARGRAERYVVSNVDRVTFGSGMASTNPPYQAGGPVDARRARNARATVPSGTVVSVRMIDAIDSNSTDVGRAYRATLETPLAVNGRTIAPRGADATVQVVRVDQSGRLAGDEDISLVLQEVAVDGRRYAANTQHAEVSSESGNKDNVKVIGGTAVVGAIIGAIAGGGKGAAIGAATGAGAGAAIQAIRGRRVQIPSETVLNFALAEPLYID